MFSGDDHHDPAHVKVCNHVTRQAREKIFHSEPYRD